MDKIFWLLASNLFYKKLKKQCVVYGLQIKFFNHLLIVKNIFFLGGGEGLGYIH